MGRVVRGRGFHHLSSHPYYHRHPQYPALGPALPIFQHIKVLITPKHLYPMSYPKIYFPTCHLWLPDPRQARMTISVTETARTCSPATSKCQQVGYDCWSFTGSSSVSVRSGLEVQRKCILTQWVHRDMYTHAHLQICAHARPSVMEVLMNCCFSLSSYWGRKKSCQTVAGLAD